MSSVPPQAPPQGPAQPLEPSSAPAPETAATSASRIRVLPAQVANQIAAGEVVERPASVVKELCENAIDAGARRIDVEIEGGGRKLIRVVDDGSGMTPEEALLALERHATSKLREAADLMSIATLGFRGEALPSIAAVSRFSIVTRPSQALSGWQIDTEGGLDPVGRAAGSRVGTTFEVRDLFFNVPARLKFLKSDSTESGHISEMVTRLAMANPSVHFVLRSTGRTVLDLPPQSKPIERSQALLRCRLFPAQWETPTVGVEAYLAPPDQSQATSRGLYLFVGRRFVRDRGLSHAVLSGYGELIERGRFPVAAVFVHMSPSTVDVNVHPQKLEVRFLRPQEVHAAVHAAVARAVAQTPWLADSSSPVRTYAMPPPERPQRLGEGPSAAYQQPLALGNPVQRQPGSESVIQPSGLFDPERDFAGQSAAAVAGASALTGSTVNGGDPSRQSAAFPQPGEPGERGEHGELGASPAANFSSTSGASVPPASLGSQSAGIRPAAAAASATASSSTAATTSATGFFASLRFIGQFAQTYLICEGEGALVLIDQHAAHERVVYGRLKEVYSRRQLGVQRLLFPLRLTVDASDIAISSEHKATLEALGFDVEPFSETELVVRAVPELIGDASPEPLLRDILSELGSRGTTDVLKDRIDHLLATLACHSAVRAGDRMEAVRAQALLEAMDAVDLRGYCPHGRPVMLRMPLTELERRFGRT